MATFDVREEGSSEITDILFAEMLWEDNMAQAYVIRSNVSKDGKYISVVNGDSEVVFINSIEHAENLIKALRKAIELGWVN
jgi:hypothetical protein